MGQTCCVLFVIIYYILFIEAGTNLKYELVLDNMTVCENPQPPFKTPAITSFQCTIRRSKGKTYVSGRNIVLAEIPFQNLSITSYSLDASGKKKLVFQGKKLACRSFLTKTFLELGHFKYNSSNCRLLKGSVEFKELDVDKIGHGIPHWHSEGSVLHKSSLVVNGKTVYCIDTLISVKSVN